MSRRRVTGTMNRRKFLGAASAGLALIARPMIARAETKEVLIAEPVHGTGYLPLYIGIAKNLFEDVTVKIVTIETGAGHTNAVLSGQAFAFIGGPEHCAYAKAKGAELRSVVNCVDRGNVYFCAEKGMEPTEYRLGEPTSKARPSPPAPMAARRTPSRAICSRNGISMRRTT